MQQRGKVQKPLKNNQKRMKNMGKIRKPRQNLEENINARKSINIVAKPMKIWKNDGEHPPTKKIKMPKQKKMPN